MGNFQSFSGYQTTYNVALIKKYSQKIIKQNNWSVVDLFLDLLVKCPNGQISYGDSSMTYRELEGLSNKIAHWALAIGLGKGDIVPLMLDNCPQYIAVWLGLAKVGASAALINTNLSGSALVHCISVALEQSKLHLGQTYTVIIGSNYGEQIDEVKEVLQKRFNIQYCGYTTDGLVSEPNSLEMNDITVEGTDGDDNNTVSSFVNDDEKPNKPNKINKDGFNKTIHDHPETPLKQKHRLNITFNDPLYYIYTSGTTGLPKAAKISHLRFAVAGYAFKHLYGVNQSDSIYIPLPLYHSNGGMLAVSLAWQAKTNIGLRQKFSASNYFSDCQRFGCTIGVYIGEICRYIVKTKPSEHDMAHPVRLMIGNGLRPDIWPEFVKRFGVTMGEFYGSTEGNANLFNTTGKIGAIGYLPWQLRKIYPVKIVKFNMDEGVLIKNEKGLCQECKTDEVGEAIGLINDNDATRKFDGYTDPTATQNKIATNVFKEGDKWFRTGDLLRMDSEGYVYFVDRIGDTFRWKGENVATTEVSEVVTRTDGVLDSNVYGVTVEGNEGRIGMVALRQEVDKTVCLNDLYQNVTNNLPKYARPYFLRLLETVDMTGTFKYKKVDLRNDGYNPDNIRDKLYLLDDTQKTYIELNHEIYAKLVDGSIRL